jgi:hypothetical protein
MNTREREEFYRRDAARVAFTYLRARGYFATPEGYWLVEHGKLMNEDDFKALAVLARLEEWCDQFVEIYPTARNKFH